MCLQPHWGPMDVQWAYPYSAVHVFVCECARALFQTKVHAVPTAQCAECQHAVVVMDTSVLLCCRIGLSSRCFLHACKQPLKLAISSHASSISNPKLFTTNLAYCVHFAGASVSRPNVSKARSLRVSRDENLFTSALRNCAKERHGGSSTHICLRVLGAHA